MCTGWGPPDGAPLTSRTTLVWLSPALVRVAVPDSPELFWGASFAVAESAASANDEALTRNSPSARAKSLPTITIVTKPPRGELDGTPAKRYTRSEGSSAACEEKRD